MLRGEIKKKKAIKISKTKEVTIKRMGTKFD
jgi:hypothetical protein